MVSSSTDEIQEESGSATMSNGYEVKGQVPLYIQTSERRLLDEKHERKKFLGILRTIPTRAGLTKFISSGGLASPSKFHRVVDERDEVLLSVPSPSSQSRTRRFRVPFVRKINWDSLKVMSKEWIRNPMNWALLVWIVCVTISGAILFMVMTGMLNGALPRKSQRDNWFEVNNQILNALFTLMCLFMHPRRFHHLALLCRWKPEDILKLRKIYCKNGTYKPHERLHMMVVVVLLHVNCFAQYALCSLNLGYSRPERPVIGVGLCVSVAISSPAIASVYNILSPLGRDYEIDEEAQCQLACSNDSKLTHGRMDSLEKYSFMAREDHRVAVSRPEWVGGLFDLWDDISLAYLSIFCSFCLFGWNMDRLGFGNVYVHIATFILLCMAPFWIFNLAAANIDNEVIREALGLTGIALCVFGLLYGGFWRIQMRKRYNLPADKFCCGNPAATDCFQWLCCCSCALAQEVRTVDFYDVVEKRFYLKQLSDRSQFVMSPLPREDSLALFNSGPSSPYFGGDPSFPVFRTANSQSPGRFSTAVEGKPSERGNMMIPPASALMQKEGNQCL